MPSTNGARRTHAAATLSLLLAGVLLAACGGSSGNGSAASTASTSTTTTTTASVAKASAPSTAATTSTASAPTHTTQAKAAAAPAETTKTTPPATPPKGSRHKAAGAAGGLAAAIESCEQKYAASKCVPPGVAVPGALGSIKAAEKAGTAEHGSVGKYIACLRANGVGVRSESGGGSATGATSAESKAAQVKCLSDLLGAG
jgi:hypothetical protein